MKKIFLVTLFFLLLPTQLRAGFSFGLGKAIAKRGGTLIDKAAGPPLPACGSPPYFQFSPMAQSDYTGIIPLGNLNPTGHVFPTDHIYFVFKDSLRKVPVYAPGNVRIKTVYQFEYLSGNSYTDYKIEFSVCKDIVFYYAHVSSLSDSLLSQIGTFSDCQTYTTGGTTVRLCQKRVNIEVAGGEQLGTGGGQVSASLDFGAYDLRSPLPFVNASRYNSSSLYTVCPLNYFTDALRTIFLSKMGDGTTQRTVEPLCGTNMQDTANTAQGNWFKTGQPNSPEDPHLALVHDNITPSKGVFSVGNSVSSLQSGAYQFTPASSGKVNLDFNRVTSDGNVYCYESFSSAPSGFSGTILIQLTNSTSLKIEKGATGACGNGPWSFSSPTSFER